MPQSHLSCRSRLTPDDFAFISDNLGGSKGSGLERLTRDPECLEKMLDDAKLYRALLDLRGCLRVSMSLYFYVLVRHALLESELEDRDVADYLAGRLGDFSSQRRLRHPMPEDEKAYDYLYELWGEAERSEGDRRFRLLTHLGDQSLFLSGLFPRYLERRVERRGAPGLDYYEEMGKASYRMAGGEEPARRLGVSGLLLTLCHAFHTARLALNGLSERVVFLDGDPAVARLLRETDQFS